MRVESLTVERRPSYDSEYPSQLVGLVELKGLNGSQKIKLSNESLSKIFKVIADDVQRTAVENAALTRRGISDATTEPLLAGASQVEKISHD
jgi:hypothetical protein